MKEAKLVYTTDKNSPLYQSNESFLTKKGEVEKNVAGDISKIKKSIRKTIKEKHEMKNSDKKKEEELKALFLSIITIIQHKKLCTLKELLSIVNNGRIKKLKDNKLRNELQRIRTASNNTIFSFKGNDKKWYWSIKPTTESNLEKFVDYVFQHRNDCFKKKDPSKPIIPRKKRNENSKHTSDKDMKKSQESSKLNEKKEVKNLQNLSGRKIEIITTIYPDGRKEERVIIHPFQE